MNIVTTHRTPLPRWVAPLLGSAAAALIPWTLWLTYSLPAKHLSTHYDIAWIGFDIALAFAFAATAYAAVRWTNWLEPIAAVTGTLLVCDSWFDVITSSTTRERLEAGLQAGLAELPLAAICAWIVYDAAVVRGLRSS